MTITWSGPTGGLGNRMLALASASSLANLLDTEITFSWVNSPVCPCDYNELFQDVAGLTASSNIMAGRSFIQTSGWNPVKILDDFKRKIDKKIDKGDYYHGLIQSLRSFRYCDRISEDQVESRRIYGGRKKLAIHVRRTDRIAHHKALFKQNLSAYRIIKNTGIMKSLQYLVLPVDLISKSENRALLKILKQFLSENPGAVYALYCDSKKEYLQVKSYFNSLGISDSRYYCWYNRTGECNYWRKSGVRNSSVADSLGDLLSMSECNGIVQNNPASTFSLVASIIGRVKILSKQPTHEFWRKMELALGAPPNRVVT